jgi:hypothetical protein
MHRHIGPVTAVHAEHSQRKRMGAWKAAQPHEGHRHRDLCDLGQLPDLIRGIGKRGATAHVDHRLFGLHDLFCSLLNLMLVPVYRRIVAAQIDLVGILKLRLFSAHILGNVN